MAAALVDLVGCHMLPQSAAMNLERLIMEAALRDAISRM
jgi:hypothetical protein